MALNSLNNAKINKNDEYYTLIGDIEKEVAVHAARFRGKSVYCNCDDPRSNFYRFFLENFERLGLRELVCSRFNPDGRGESWQAAAPDAVQAETLAGDGSFDSEECIALLGKCDIVVSNPPFSRFRDYMSLLAGSGREFLVVGNINAAACRSVFAEISAGRLWFGKNAVKEFLTPDGERKSFGNIVWYTNMDHGARHERTVFNSSFDENVYPGYFTHDAIEVSRASEIPADYRGAMGVPITFLPKMCPEQFELLECCEPALELESYKRFPCFRGERKSRQVKIGGVLCQKVYHRVLVKLKRQASSTKQTIPK